MTIEIYNDVTSSWFDITPWIAWQGLTFSRNDVDGPNAGRDMSGTMHRGRVAVKEKISITTIPLKQADLDTLLNLLYPETINVRVNPYPRTGSRTVLYMYSNNVKLSFQRRMANGDEYQVASFPLIEN